MKGYPGLTKLLTEHDLEVKERLEKRQLFRWARWIGFKYAQHEMLKDLPGHSDKQ